MNELCNCSAVELARMLAARKLSCVEVMDAHLAQIDAVNPRLNAIVTLDATRARASGCASRRELLARFVAAAMGIADRAQRPGLDARHAHHVRFHAVRRQRSRQRRPDRRAHPRCRCDCRGQDEYTRVRRRIADVQSRLRRYAQPLRSHSHLRRQQRRRGSSAGGAHVAARRRQRSRRLASQPGEFLQRARLAPHTRPRAVPSDVESVGRHVGARSDGAQRRRHRAVSVGARGRRPARTDRVDRSRLRVLSGDAARPARRARRA